MMNQLVITLTVVENVNNEPWEPKKVGDLLIFFQREHLNL